jgi:hypothetical protein
LLLPDPVRDIILAPKRHITNEELVKDSKFWNIVRNFVSSMLARTSNTEAKDVIELVALNFGRWETRQAEDPLAMNCHGHAHFNLTPNAASVLKKTFR